MNRLPLTAIVTSVAAVAAGLSGGVFALLIGTKFGTTPRTDGFFGAFSLYSVVLILAQSWNPNIVAALVASPQRFDVFNRLLGGLALIALGCGVLFLGLGDPLATLVTGHSSGPAYSTAHDALLVLWPAAAGQLFAGLAATMLNALGKTAQAQVCLALGSVGSITAFIGLEPALGVDALPVSLVIGTCVTVAVLTALLAREGWRPPALKLGVHAGGLGLLLLSSVTNVIGQLLYAVSIVVAARVGPGATTIYSFAFFGQALVKTLVTLSIPMVLAGPLATTWDRTAASLRPYLDDTLRIGLLMLLPIVAAAVFVGDDLGRAVLTKMSSHQVHEIVVVFLILSGSIILSQVSLIELQALLTLRRYTQVAVMSVGLLVVQIAVSAAAAATGSLYAVGAAFTITVAVRTIALLQMIHGRALGIVVRRIVRDAVPVTVVAAACFGLGAGVLRPSSAGGDAATYAGALVLFVVATTLFMPTYRNLGVRLLRSLRPAAAPGRSFGASRPGRNR